MGIDGSCYLWNCEFFYRYMKQKDKQKISSVYKISDNEMEAILNKRLKTIHINDVLCKMGFPSNWDSIKTI